MANEAWTWADLDDEQFALVRETERTLGSEVVVAYRRAETTRVGRAGVAIPPATLDDSQLACLQGVDSRIGCVAVAWGTEMPGRPTPSWRRAGRRESPLRPSSPQLCGRGPSATIAERADVLRTSPPPAGATVEGGC